MRGLGSCRHDSRRTVQHGRLLGFAPLLGCMRVDAPTIAANIVACIKATALPSPSLGQKKSGCR
jgi:hypothetical protein